MVLTHSASGCLDKAVGCRIELSSLPANVSPPCCPPGPLFPLCCTVSFSPWNPHRIELHMLNPVFSNDLMPIDSLVYQPSLCSSDSLTVLTLRHDFSARGQL